MASEQIIIGHNLPLRILLLVLIPGGIIIIDISSVCIDTSITSFKSSIATATLATLIASSVAATLSIVRGSELISWLIDQLSWIFEIVLLYHDVKAGFVKLLVKSLGMLVKDVLVNKLSSLKLLLAVIDLTLIDLPFMLGSRVALCIVLLHLLENGVLMRGKSLPGSFRQTIVCCAHILVLEILASNPSLSFYHRAGDPLRVSEVLGSTLCSKSALIIVLFSAVEAIRVDSPQVEQENIKVLGFCQVTLCMFLNLVEEFWRDLLLRIKDLRNKTLAEAEISLNAVIR